MARTTVKTMNPIWLQKLNKKNKNCCTLCNLGFNVGDEIQSRYHGGNKPTDLYHQKCWDSLFLLTDEDEDEDEFTFTQPRTKTITKQTQTITERTKTEIQTRT